MIISILCVLVVSFSTCTADVECEATKEKCEFWLVVEHSLTMSYKNQLVYANNSRLYLKNEHPSNFTTHVPISDVITLDGFPRMVVSVNGSVPGPSLIVHEGQILTIHVTNKLLSEEVTIHWHGQHQMGTPFMDGAGYITQCPIGSGQSFTYRFKAFPKGTFWYHSHVGAQRLDGLFGALIVKPRQTSNAVDPEEFIMMIGEWFHEPGSQIFLMQSNANFLDGIATPYVGHSVDGSELHGPPWVSALINGKGRQTAPKSGQQQRTPITWYNVTKGREYRFRVIGAGAMLPFRVSVDQHTIQIVASDGYDIEQREVDSFIINPGERFDFILTANKTVDNYWIRFESLEVDVIGHSVEAVLHYAGADDAKEPITKKCQCTGGHPCNVLNCPFPFYPIADNTSCLAIDQLKAKDPEPTPEFVKGDSIELFFNFGFPGAEEPGAINGREFALPPVSTLTQSNELEDYTCRKEACGEGKVCKCLHTVDLPQDKTVQMTWLALGSGKGELHPMHLHGHHLHVVKMGYATHNQSTGKPITDNKDFKCHGNTSLNYCNNVTWSNSSWLHGNVPGMNLVNPPRKDTLVIPSGGYVVLRFKTNNPGKWFLHCHVTEHMLAGMAMIINEAEAQHPVTPQGFPTCRNFYNDRERDYKDKDSQGSAALLPSSTLVVILAAYLFAQIGQWV